MAIQDMISQLMKQQIKSKNRMTALSQPSPMGMPGSIPSEDLNLIDPEDLGIDHNSQDWINQPEIDEEEERRITTYVRQSFDEAYRARQEMELEWALATAFFEGRQWLRISSTTRNLIQLQNPSEPNRYMIVQKMRPLIDGVVGKLTQVSPDAYAIPLSDTERDRNASDEANIIC